MNHSQAISENFTDKEILLVGHNRIKAKAEKILELELQILDLNDDIKAYKNRLKKLGAY